MQLEAQAVAHLRWRLDRRAQAHVRAGDGSARRRLLHGFARTLERRVAAFGNR
jgi:hypothetical protein